MAITAQFLSQCTEAQINKGVAWAKLSSYKITGLSIAQLTVDHNTAQNLVKDLNCGLFNPCEYPNDIMPIAFANEISVIFDGMPMAATEVALGESFCSMELSSFSGSPLRAICEVYILMSVSK